MARASAAASAADTQTPAQAQAQARQTVKDCEHRLARYQAALDAGADPAVVTQWINDAHRTSKQRRRSSTHSPLTAQKRETPLTAQQIQEITESLIDIAQRIHAAQGGLELRAEPSGLRLASQVLFPGH